MTADRWQQVESLLERALELSPPERETFLARECGADAALKDEVEALLVADEKAARFFAQPILSLAGSDPDRQPEGRSTSPTVAEPTPGESSGARRDRAAGTVLAGRYRIVGLLGRGGMGEVYRADDLKLEAQVALKLLPQPIEETSRRLERFFDEVRIARRITHPSVCRVYDVGEVDGRHFLSMELIDGDDLASLLRRVGRLVPEKALEIAHQLAGGLAAVHREGVLHLDLKPANLMIDGRGRARITDFGVATLAGLIGGAELRWGTLSYMAPEQLAAGEVSAATDVYALGLVLYELFTGRRPFAGVRPSGGRPSGETAAELVERRRESLPPPPSRWVEGLDPAVDRAVLRCLEPQPDDRDTAAAVAAALGGRADANRWRPAAGRAIPHRPHWTVEDKLGAGGFGEVWLARHAKTGEQRVFKFSHDAARRRALEREITVFRLLKEELGDRDDIVRILDWGFDEPPYFIESEYTEGGSLAAWAAAQGGLAAVPLAVRLEIVAQVATAVAAAHSVGVLHKDVKPANVLIAADPGGDAAIAVRARLTDFGLGAVTERQRLDAAGITVLGLTEETVDSTAGTRLYMAPERVAGQAATVEADVYALGVLLYQMVVGDFARALAPGWRRDVEDELLCEDIAAAVDGVPERRLANARQLAERLRSLAERRRLRQLRRHERREAAAAHLALARSRQRRKLVAGVIAVLALFAGGLGLQAHRIGREAERANREAAAARQVAGFMAELFEVSDPYREPSAEVTAREILDRGAEEIERLAEQPEIQARLKHTLGVVYRNLGAYDTGRELLEGALAIQRRLHGDRHLEVAESLTDLGTLLRITGRNREAEPLYREALAMNRRLLGEEHLQVARGLNNLAMVLRSQEDYRAAEPLLRQGIAILRRVPGGEHPQLGAFLNSLAKTLQAMGRTAEAAPLYDEALAIKRRLLGEEHTSVAISLTDIAGLELDRGDPAAAEGRARRAVEIFRLRLPAGHWRIATAESALGACRSGLGRYGEAEPLLLGAHAVLEEKRGAGALETREAVRRIVALYRAWGRGEKAAEYRARLPASDRRGVG